VADDRPRTPSWAPRLPGIARGSVTAGFVLPVLSFIVLAVDPRFEHACGVVTFEATGVGPFPFSAALLAWLGLAASLGGIAAALLLLELRRVRRGLHWGDHGWFLFVVLGLLVLVVDLVMVHSVSTIATPNACAR
jgi:hypothetical protein